MAVISVITNEDRSKILLSLNKRYAIARMYTCTAGFMEPSETMKWLPEERFGKRLGLLVMKLI